MTWRNLEHRRGKVRHMYSDNGTNFVGAEKEMRELAREMDLVKAAKTMEDSVTWHWNPPASAHMGGSWERAIRTIKSVLHVIMKDAAIRENTFRSLLIEVEFIINSRPLTFISVDHNDEEALTPNHFLLGSASGSMDQAAHPEANLATRKQYQHAQLLALHFWKRWIKEYLPIIARRTKWHTPTKPLEVGDVVFVIDEGVLKNTWKGESLWPYTKAQRMEL